MSHFSTAESIQLCYTDCNVVHIHAVHIVHVVLVEVNNLIRALYNRQQWHLVASLPLPWLVTRCPPWCDGWCGHQDELTPLGVTVWLVIMMT